MLGVNQDNILLLSTPFPSTPVFGTNCCASAIMLCFLEINDVVLYCISILISLTDIIFNTSSIIVKRFYQIKIIS